MKHVIITIVIAAITAIGGYYLGTNKGEIFTSNASKNQTSHRCKVVIQVNPYGSHSHSTTMMTRKFYLTEMSIIKSGETIRRAIADYGLVDILDAEQEQLHQFISDNITTKQERGTDLIAIETAASTKEKAQQIIYAVVNTYDTRRKEKIEATRKEVIQKYNQKIKQQEAKVEDYRKKLFKISKKHGFPHHGLSTPPYSEAKPHKPAISIEQHSEFAKTKDEYEREFSILQSFKGAEIKEAILVRFEITPLLYHQQGWTKEIEAMMEARKSQKP